MSKFIEMTVISVYSDGSKTLDKMLVNTDIITLVYDKGDCREISFMGGSSLNVKNSYGELKENLTGYKELKLKGASNWSELLGKEKT